MNDVRHGDGHRIREWVVLLVVAAAAGVMLALGGGLVGIAFVAVVAVVWLVAVLVTRGRRR